MRNLGMSIAGLSALLRSEMDFLQFAKPLIFSAGSVSLDNVHILPSRRYMALLRKAAHRHGLREKHIGRPTFQYRKAKREHVAS